MTRPTSKDFKLLAGTARADRDSPPAVELPAPDAIKAMPPAPQFLNPDGKELWETEGALLVAQGRMRPINLKPFAQLCYTHQQMMQKMKASLEITASEHNTLLSMWKHFDCIPEPTKSPAFQPATGDKAKDNPFARNAKQRA